MKGTEGVDYVITECAHCEGTGKCVCHDCHFRAAMRNVDKVPVETMDGDYGVDPSDPDVCYNKYSRNCLLSEYNDGEVEVLCSVCKGVGRVVFWRED